MLRPNKTVERTLEEGVDVEAFYVCVHLTLICESRSTVLRGLPRLTYKCQDSLISVNFTLISAGFSEI